MAVVVTPYALASGGPLVTDETRKRRPGIDLEQKRTNSRQRSPSRGLVTHRYPDDVLEAADDLEGAALDVFEDKPLPESSPLWVREDTVLENRVVLPFDHGEAFLNE